MSERTEAKKWLTQSEVDGLPVGTAVSVIWSGGNGPHIYSIERERDLTLAVANGIRHELVFVGSETWNTRVRLIEEQNTLPTERAESELCDKCGFTLYNHIGNTGCVYPCWTPSGKFSEDRYTNHPISSAVSTSE